MYTVTHGTFRTPRGRQVTMAYRTDSSDYNTVNACLSEDEYGLRDVHLGATTAFDVGAHIGGVTVALLADNPELRVVAVEPVPGNVELLRENVERNGLADRAQIIQGAVGDGTSVSVWHGYRGNENAEHHAFIGNSSLAYDHGGEGEHDETQYVSIRLADFVNLLDVERHGPWTDNGGPSETHQHVDTTYIDWLKIDTEGAEWTFLASPERWRLRYIVGEWHPVRGKTRADLLAILGDTHEVAFTGPEGGPGGFTAVAK